MKPFLTFDKKKKKIHVKIGYSGYDYGKQVLRVIDPLSWFKTVSFKFKKSPLNFIDTSFSKILLWFCGSLNLKLVFIEFTVN